MPHMRRLPPLTAIEAFVHVARLGSIKAAADELALSSPALSRRVQALERFIGKPLFERRHQALRLNAEGDRLLTRIAPALDTMSDAVEEMTSGIDLLRMRLGILPLFAEQQLLHRLPDLRRQHPELHLDIDTAPPQRAASSPASVAGAGRPTDQIAAMALPEAGVDLRALSELLEKHFIEQALARHDRVVAHAARTLGLRRTTLTEKLRRYAIRTD